MLANANIYVDADGVLCVEVAGGHGDAIKLRSADECFDFLVTVATEANRHFGTAVKVFGAHDDMAAIANDLARKTLELPPDCDTLTPPTFDERHAANEEALGEIHDMVWGKDE